MSRILYPGTFDPFTNGHLNVVERALTLFDEVVIGVLNNHIKEPRYDLRNRSTIINFIFENYPNVQVIKYDGLTVDLVKESGCNGIIRGIRNNNDFENEKILADINKHLGVETIFIQTDPRLSFISSSFVKEMLLLNKDVSQYIPEKILKFYK